MTQIKVITGGMGQLLNPFDQYGDDMSTEWQAFNQANPPYPIINPGLAKEGETVKADLVWQYQLRGHINWVTPADYSKNIFEQWADVMYRLHDAATRQAFLIDDTPKEGDGKQMCSVSLATELVNNLFNDELHGCEEYNNYLGIFIDIIQKHKGNG